MKTELEATIHIWSRIGHTPVTGRNGAYCDELVKTTITVSSREEAIAKAKELKSQTTHSDKGHVYIPNLPNQNYRSTWF